MNSPLFFDFLTALQSLSFSVADENSLDQLDIKEAGLLLLHGTDQLRDEIDSTRQRGAAGLWSNDNLYKHLEFLLNTYTKQNETSTRMFIDVFFFRVATMVPPDKRVVLMLEKSVPIVHPRSSMIDTVSGIIDYTALVADTVVAQKYLRAPPKLNAATSTNIIALFAAGAKASEGTLLDDHIPQAILELVACAKHLEKDHIRGVLTTGDKWMFIAVDLDGEGEGATYWRSEVIEWRSRRIAESRDVTVPVTSDWDDPALICGILSSWVPNSFSKFNGDEWFSKL